MISPVSGIPEHGMKKRILSVLIACLILVCSASCGSQEESLLAEDINDAVYRFREVKITAEFPEIELPAMEEGGEDMEFPADMEGMEDMELPADMEGMEAEAADADEPVTPEETETTEAAEGTEAADGAEEAGAVTEEEAELPADEVPQEALAEEEFIDEEEDSAPEVQLLYAHEDRLRAVVLKRSMRGPGGLYLFSCNGEGEEQEIVPVQSADFESFGTYCVADDGGFYALSSKTVVDEATGQESNAYSVVCFSAGGEQTASYDLPIEKPKNSDGYYWLQGMYNLGGGRLLFVDNRYVFGFDTNNQHRWNIYEGVGDYMDASVSVLRDGSVLLGSYGEKSYTVRELDVETGHLGDEMEVPGSFYGSMITGTTHDALFYASRAVWFFDKKGSKTGKVVDLTASDMLVDDVSGVTELPDDRIAMLTSSWSEAGRTPFLYIGTHVPASEVGEKKEITISCVYASSGLMRKVVEFNRNSDSYRIRVADYSQYESDDYMYPYTKLNTDIVSGHIPDMIVIDDMLPLESYISKGILADLTDLMAADEMISREEYLDNVFDTYRVDGALYQIIPSFMVYTGVMRTDVLHGRTSLPMREFSEVCDEQGVRVRDAFGSMTRGDLMNVLLYIQGMEFVDLATGRCEFDSQAFTDLLNLLVQFPVEEDKSDYAEQQKAFREGRALLMLYGLASFTDYSNLRYGNFGTDITMIGIPGGTTSGSVIIPQMQLAMTTSTEYPEVVWEFLRSFLSEEYQNSVEWGFPVRMGSLRKLSEKAKERPYYIDENGKRVEYDNTWWVAGQEVVIPPMTDEEIEQVIGFLKGCDRRAFNNGTVTNIINEETAAFFEGQKSVEEVTKIIQSRAKIYVHENR